MMRVSRAKFSFRKNALSAVALSSTVLVSSVAAAASLSVAFLWLTTAISSKGGALVKWRDVVSVLSLATLSGSTKPSWTTVTKPGTITSTPKPVDSSSGAAGVPATKLGINLSGPSYWSSNRNFMNLLAGDFWRLNTSLGVWVDMPDDRLNGSREVVDIRPGENVVRLLTRPTKFYRGIAVDIKCRWQGSGTLAIEGDSVKNLRMSRNAATFTHSGSNTDSARMRLITVEAADPIRNLDCREADANPNATFDPTFLADAKKYSVLRFMKWTSAVESNASVTWASRSKPNQGRVAGPDGVALEYMIQLANETGSDPWFAIPWNADEEYVRKFAETVRDQLNPSRRAYVEVSNEVWNYVYKVTHQASAEAAAARLSTDAHQGMLMRYAQKTGQVMDVWSSVFSGQMHRIVRVASIQTGAWNAEVVLGFGDTAKKVDALASAPYFHDTLAAGTITTASSLDQYFKTLGAAIPGHIKNAKDTKAIASRFGLRYITYEAGQHLTSPDDVTQLDRIQKDARMGGLYTTYLTLWKDQIGDLMVLFEDYGGASRYGAWGQRDYVGQPLSEAPKENAVELFRQSYVR